jgi:hypothetical protein
LDFLAGILPLPGTGTFYLNATNSKNQSREIGRDETEKSTKYITHEKLKKKIY